MVKTYVYANVSTKKGILQLIFDYDKNMNFMNTISDLESFVYYTEVFMKEGDKTIKNYELSTYSPVHYIGTRLDDNHCMSRSGIVYELNDGDIIEENLGVMLTK